MAAPVHSSVMQPMESETARLGEARSGAIERIYSEYGPSRTPSEY